MSEQKVIEELVKLGGTLDSTSKLVEELKTSVKVYTEEVDSLYKQVEELSLRVRYQHYLLDAFVSQSIILAETGVIPPDKQKKLEALFDKANEYGETLIKRKRHTPGTGGHVIWV